MSQLFDDRRGSSAKRGYSSAWQRARAAFLARHPLCVMCSTRNKPVQATVVDHIVAPRLGEAIDSGDATRLAAARALFWDSDNWQSLCATCHNSTKQRLERSGRTPGCTADGRPTDPGHHWNRNLRG